MRIYLDNQASSPVDAVVATEMAAYSSSTFGNPHSAGHAVGWAAEKVVADACSKVARLIGSDPDEIILTSGATESNNIAILGVRNDKARSIVRSAIEHKSIINACEALVDEHGFESHIALVNSEGKLELDQLESLLKRGASMVSIGAVNSEIGTIQDVATIGELCRQYGAIFHCDAAQAVLAMDVSNLSVHADLISLSGHKIYGPMGIGAIYVGHHVRRKLKPLMYGGGQQDGIRPGTVPVPLSLGFGIAAQKASGSAASEEREYVAKLRNRFWDNLLRNGIDVELNGPSLSNRHPGNANICFNGIDALELLGALQPKVAASSGSACTSGIPEPSYVLTSIGLDEDQARSSLRFSFGKMNTVEDADLASEQVALAVRRIVKR